MIRVVLADDQALVRAGLKALLDARDDIEVVGEAADGAQAVGLAKTLRPDVVLMDIRMPVLDGLQATRQITSDSRLGNVRIIILTTFELDEYLFEALRYGASGFLVKDTEPVDLVTAVRVVARGDSLVSPVMTKRLIAEFASRSKEPGPRQRAGRPDRTRARGDGARGRRSHQRRDRRAAVYEPGHGPDPREPGDEQAGGPGPRPARGHGLRNRVGAAGLVRLIGRFVGSLPDRRLCFDSSGPTGARCHWPRALCPISSGVLDDGGDQTATPGRRT